MRALIAGGAGFLGSHVAAHLLAAGHEVAILDDLSGGSHQNVTAIEDPSHPVLFVKRSVCNPDAVEDVVAEFKPSVVFHLAAYAAESLSHHIRHFTYYTNVCGSMNVVNACVKYGVKRLIFTSSIAVYGSRQTPFLEMTIPRPEDPYGIAKLAVEYDLKAAYKHFGLEYTIFRPHNLYGERSNLSDRYRNVVAIFMRQCLRNEPMTIFGDGTQVRAFSYVGDVAPLIAESAFMPECRNEIFNIGGDTACQVNDLAVQVADALGVEHRVVHLPARNEVHTAVAGHGKVRRVFGDRPLTTLVEGLHRTAEWARAHADLTPKLPPWGTLEVERGLPESWRGAA